MIEGLLGPSLAYPKLIKHYVFKLRIEDVDDMHSGLLCDQVLACLLVIGNIEQNPGPNSCCIRGCPNVYGKGARKRTFFSFPSNEQLRNAWIANMPQAKEEGWLPLNHHTICQDHFEGGT